MKKIQLLLMLTLCFMVGCNEIGKAQTSPPFVMYRSTDGSITNRSVTLVNDTLTNADSTWFLLPAGTLNKWSTNFYEFSFTLDTVSGTTTPGTVVSQGSYDGISWFNLSGGSSAFANASFSGTALGTDGNNCDSLTWAVANCANRVNKMYTMGGTGKYVSYFSTVLWNLAPRVTYIRLKFVSSGTQVTRIYNVTCTPFKNP